MVLFLRKRRAKLLFLQILESKGLFTLFSVQLTACQTRCSNMERFEGEVDLGFPSQRIPEVTCSKGTSHTPVQVESFIRYTIFQASDFLRPH